MAGFQSVVPAVVGGAVNYANTRQEVSQARADTAAQLEAARRQRAWEREQARIAREHAQAVREQELAWEREQARAAREQAEATRAHERRMAEEAFEREAALERERTRRAREIYAAENPPAEADPGLVAERLSTLEDRAAARETRTRDLAAAKAEARARAASAGITGGGTAKAIQRNLIDRSRKRGERDEAKFQIRLEEQDKRHAKNLLDAENRRRRAMLGLETQLESRG